MFLNHSKFLFLMILISGTLITIFSNSWMGAWMGLEINLLLFIPLMTNTNKSMATEASLKYFLTQALASSTLLFSVILLNQNNFFVSFFPENNYIINLMINSSLLLKMGAVPFHFWFPGVMEGLNWMNTFILMTWQKIAPLMMISYCWEKCLILIIIIMSVIIGSLSGLNQTSLRKLMAYSLINHIGWMLSALIIGENSFFMYFIMYSFLSLAIISIFNSFKMFHINQMFSLSNSPILKFCMMISLLSLGGLPPFLGFLPKWIIIQNLIEMNQFFLIATMVVMTLITLYFYLRITYSSFMMMNSELKWVYQLNYNNLNKYTLILSIFSIAGLFMITILFNIF